MTSRGSHLRPTHLTTLMGQVRSSVTPYNPEATFPRRPSLHTQAELSGSAPGPPRYQTLGSVSGIILRCWDYRLMCRSPTLCGRCLRKGQCEPHPQGVPSSNTTRRYSKFAKLLANHHDPDICSLTRPKMCQSYCLY